MLGMPTVLSKCHICGFSNRSGISAPTCPQCGTKGITITTKSGLIDTLIVSKRDEWAVAIQQAIHSLG